MRRDEIFPPAVIYAALWSPPTILRAHSHPLLKVSGRDEAKGPSPRPSPQPSGRGVDTPAGVFQLETKSIPLIREISNA
jgi:hypothetical protein